VWWDFHNGSSSLSDSDPAFYGWRTNSDGTYLVDGGIVNGSGGLGGSGNAYPTYYVSKLMPYFAANGDAVVSATSDYPLLATYAVKRTNGSLTLLVINKSSSSNLTASFNFADYLPYATAAIHSYGIPQDDAARTGIGSADIAHSSLSGVQTTFSNTFAPFSVSVIVMTPGNQPPFTPGNLAATGSNTTVALTWSAVAGADSYIVRRSTTSGGNYTDVATGVSATGYLDTGLVNGMTYYYVVAATNSFGLSADSAELGVVPAMKLTGTIIGSPGSYSNQGNTITNVFDGNTNTFYDAASGSGNWAGLDLGSGAAATVTQIKFCPRANSGSRMVGGQFQGANVADFSSGVVTLFTVSSSPASGVMTVQSVTNASSFRYLRYIGPANGWCNVAEVEFWGANAVSSAPMQFSFAVVGNQLQMTWPADHTGWRLQAQTNSLDVGLSTNWSDVSGSAQTNMVMVPLNRSNGAVFFRLVWP
jgi:hypothetical protein